MSRFLRFPVPRGRALGALVCAATLAAVLAAPADGRGQTPERPAAQDEFVPVDRLPSQEELPAAPLVMTAYAAAWLVIFAYVVSIWRRLARVEREMAAIGRTAAAADRTSPARRPAGEGGAG